MKRYRTIGLILRRINFGEHDRIVTFLTAGHGKVGAIAKGVRRPKSKLAGGMELFSISELSFITTRGELDQLVSTRLVTYYGHIVEDYDRLQLGYKALELIEKLTEETAGPEYFELVQQFFEELDSKQPLEIVELWFRLQLLRLLGQQPNVLEDQAGQPLQVGQHFDFDPREGNFVARDNGRLNADHVKAWRLLLLRRPAEVTHVKGLAAAAEQSVDSLRQLFGQLFQLA